MSAYCVPVSDDTVVDKTDMVPILQDLGVPREEAESYFTTAVASAGEQTGGGGGALPGRRYISDPAPRCRGLPEIHVLPLVVSPVSLNGVSGHLERASASRNRLGSLGQLPERGLLLFHRHLGGWLGFWPSAPGETKSPRVMDGPIVNL